MPFRRKHRSSFFGSSRSADKENANDGMQEPMLPQPPVSPRLFRSHSDNTQRSCCDINPNTVSSMKSITHRNGVLSTKEKMANLLQLNSTLVKEVSFLRNSQQALSSNVENLKEELQATGSTARALRVEKIELAQEINKLKSSQSEMKDSLEAEKNDAEGRLECMSLVVDNLQSMNGVLAEEAARLREDADRYATERHTLLADLDRIMEEKTFLQQFVDSIRAGEEEFRKEMQQALLQAEREKKALSDEKLALLEENAELQMGNEELKKEVEKLGAEKIESEFEKAELRKEKDSLSTVAHELQEMKGLLVSEKQASASARNAFNNERKQMCTEKEALECSVRNVQEDQRKAIEQFEAEKHAFECNARELSLKIKMLSEENEGAKQDIKHRQEGIENLQQELALLKEATMKAEAEAKANFEAAIKEKDEAIAELERQLQDAATKALSVEGALISNAKALECKLDAAHEALNEAKSLVKAKSDEIIRCTEKLDNATHEIFALEGKLVSEKEKQKRLEVHIQTMKGDLLVAEDAAIQAQNKAKVIEKEASSTIERRTREASQKIGALESKLTAMAERQIDLENHIRVKESACKAAVQAESQAKAKLRGLLEIVQARGKNIEGYFGALRTSMEEMQRSALRGNESIASLQAEFAALMDIQAEPTNKVYQVRKKRGRSRAKAYQAQLSCS